MPIRLSPKTSISCIILQVLSYVCAALWSIGRKRDFLSIILGSNRIGMVFTTLNSPGRRIISVLLFPRSDFTDWSLLHPLAIKTHSIKAISQILRIMSSELLLSSGFPSKPGHPAIKLLDKLEKRVCCFEGIAKQQAIPDANDTAKKLRNQIPPLAVNVTSWWLWVTAKPF